MKNILSHLGAAVVIIAVIGLAAVAADNIYLAPASIDATTHAPSALSSTDDGTTQTLVTAKKVTLISPNIVASGTTYTTAGTLVGGKITFSGVTRGNGGNASLQSISLVDKNNQKKALELVLFDRIATTGTYADAATTGIASADAANVVARIPIAASDYVTVDGTNAIATKALDGLGVKLSGTNGMAGLIYSSGTSTATYSVGTNAALILKLGVEQN